MSYRVPGAQPTPKHGIGGTAARGRVAMPLRIVNAVGGPVGRLVWPLDDEAMLDRAVTATGLDDFGDESFRQPFKLLLRSLNADASLNFIGRIAAWKHTLHLLGDRLRLIEERKRHPEIADQEIRRPIFVTGLPRSGTTLLHRLLAEDPASRAPLTWEVMFPMPAPAHADGDRDPRIARTDRALRWMDSLAPEFRVIHALGARFPQECIGITSYSFESPQFNTTHSVPSYQSWLTQHDHHGAYAFHRNFLQHLQWRRPAHQWVLKAPAHLFAFDAILRTYPDARIIQTHRDPLKIVPSTANLTRVLYRAFSNRIDSVEIGREVVGRWSDGVARAMQSRAAPDFPHDRLLDVSYASFVRSPMTTVRQIYASFGMTLSAEAEDRMKRYLAINTKDRFGEHRYTLDQFGLAEDDVRDRFKAYYDWGAAELEATEPEAA